MENELNMEKGLSSVALQILKICKVQSVEGVTHSLLMKPNSCTKDALASFVLLVENVTNTANQLFKEISVFPTPQILATLRVVPLKVDNGSKVGPS